MLLMMLFDTPVKQADDGVAMLFFSYLLLAIGRREKYVAHESERRERGRAREFRCFALSHSSAAHT